MPLFPHLPEAFKFVSGLDLRVEAIPSAVPLDMAGSLSQSLAQAIASQPIWLLPVLSLLSIALVKHTQRRRALKGLRLPPGPKPLPIIGNALDVPTEMMGQRFREMTEKYGEFVQIMICVFD